MVMSLAAILPWIELFIGCSMLVGYMTRAVAAVSFFMLGTFIFALSSVLLRGISLPNCGCFGFGWHPSPGQTLGMDIVLLVLAVFAFRHGSKRLSLDNWIAEGS